MSETPTPPRSERGAAKPWHVVKAALRKTPGRPGDQQIFWATRQLAELTAKLGLPIVLSLFGGAWLIMQAPTQAQMVKLTAAFQSDASIRREQHAALLGAIDRSSASYAQTTDALIKLDSKLDSKLGEMESVGEWLKGAVSARLRCPPCPSCPPCPGVTIVTPTPPTTGSIVAPPKPSPRTR